MKTDKEKRLIELQKAILEHTRALDLLIPEYKTLSEENGN
jgi:hypothetical protein